MVFIASKKETKKKKKKTKKSKKKKKEKKTWQIRAIRKGKKRILPISQGGENFVSIRSTALETNKPEKLQNILHPRGEFPCQRTPPTFIKIRGEKTGHATRYRAAQSEVQTR